MAWSWVGSGGGALTGFTAGSAVGGPIGAGVGATVGFLGGGLLGGSKKKQSDDPLAGIRSQLLALSGQVPGMVERQKKLIGEEYGKARTEGAQNVRESARAERGFGPGSSIETRMQNELIDALAKSQAEAELEAEMGGLKMQVGILQGAAGITSPEDYAPSFGEQLLGIGGQMAGQELTNLGEEKRMKTYLSGLKDNYGSDVSNKISSQPSVVTGDEPYMFYKKGMLS